MLKPLLLGVMGAVSALSGHWLANNRTVFWPEKSEALAKPAYEFRKAGVLNVPLLRKGELQGYIVIRLGYAVDGPTDGFNAQTVEAIMQDEAFRTIYSDQSINPRTLDKFDLTAFTKQLGERVRSRVASEAFKDALVNEFHFVPASALR